LEFRIWILFGIWDLGFEIWDFSFFFRQVNYCYLSQLETKFDIFLLVPGTLFDSEDVLSDKERLYLTPVK
jgi:hypothetical protein